MTVPPAKESSAQSGLRTAFAGVVLLMWMLVGAILGVITCWAVAFTEAMPFIDPEKRSARPPVSEYVYVGIVLGGVALGCVAYRTLRPRR